MDFNKSKQMLRIQKLIKILLRIKNNNKNNKYYSKNKYRKIIYNKI